MATVVRRHTFLGSELSFASPDLPPMAAAAGSPSSTIRSAPERHPYAITAAPSHSPLDRHGTFRRSGMLDPYEAPAPLRVRNPDAFPTDLRLSEVGVAVSTPTLVTEMETRRSQYGVLETVSSQATPSSDGSGSPPLSMPNMPPIPALWCVCFSLEFVMPRRGKGTGCKSDLVCDRVAARWVSIHRWRYRCVSFLGQLEGAEVTIVCSIRFERRWPQSRRRWPSSGAFTSKRVVFLERVALYIAYCRVRPCDRASSNPSTPRPRRGPLVLSLALSFPLAYSRYPLSWLRESSVLLFHASAQALVSSFSWAQVAAKNAPPEELQPHPDPALLETGEPQGHEPTNYHPDDDNSKFHGAYPSPLPPSGPMEVTVGARTVVANDYDGPHSNEASTTAVTAKGPGPETSAQASLKKDQASQKKEQIKSKANEVGKDAKRKANELEEDGEKALRSGAFSRYTDGVSMLSRCIAKKKADKWEKDASRELRKPEVWGSLLGACALARLSYRDAVLKKSTVNLAVLGGVGYLAYSKWHLPRWDRRVVTATVVGVGALFSVTGCAFNVLLVCRS